MRVTVSGGLGFIGSFVSEELIRRGHHVTIIDRERGNVVDDIEGASVVRCDVRDTHLYAPDAVVHCAAPVGAVALLYNQDSVTHEIVDVTKHVAHLCARESAPLVNISTSEVYGFSGEYVETDDLRVPDKHSARLEYAVGKIAGEHLLHGCPGLDFTNIRPFNVTGPRQTSAKGFVLPTFVEQALQNIPLTVFGDGSQRRAFTSVFDLARFICCSLDQPFNRQTINVGNPDNDTTIIDLAQRVIDATSSHSTINFTSGKIVHGEAYEEAEGKVKVPIITQARHRGFFPQDSLDDLIAATIAHVPVAA